jgi:thiol-disulfide isomerase/thioredoxin
MTVSWPHRRAILTGLGAGALAGMPALAATTPEAVRRNRAFRPWTVAANTPPAPLDGTLATIHGQEISLRQWIGQGPSIVILWAMWCPPCIAEKPALASLQRELTARGSKTQLRCLQAYDDTTLRLAHIRLRSMDCGDLQIARASPGLERRFVRFFGASPIDPSRTSLPSVVLLDGAGVEIGRAQGALQAGSRSYWADPAARRFLAGLDDLLRS